MHRHRSSTVQSQKETGNGNQWKSDMCVNLNKNRRKRNNVPGGFHKCTEEYYKNYDHDDVPVKDDNSSYYNFKSKVSDQGDLAVDADSSLDLDQLENKIYSNISQELQTDSSCAVSLDSNIKLFRRTVEEIFENFHHAMTDFELYKKRFEDILSKNKEQSIAEMEDFIKDMFQHIASSESGLSQYTSKSTQQSTDKDSNMAVIDDSTASDRSVAEQSFDMPKATIEAYKNDKYKTDSCTGDDSSNDKSRTGAFCINFLNSNRCVQIKLNNRDMVSEINIREKEREIMEAASAGNIKRLNAKKIEVDDRERDEDLATEKDIPVKMSSPKKNIHLNEDFTYEVDKTESNRSFFYKICNYLCRRLRKKV